MAKDWLFVKWMKRISYGSCQAIVTEDLRMKPLQTRLFCDRSRKETASL
jgi:hypothetical protein